MFTLGDPGAASCDASAAANFLPSGPSGLGGLTLAASPPPRRQPGRSHASRSVIMVCLLAAPATKSTLKRPQAQRPRRLPRRCPSHSAQLPRLRRLRAVPSPRQAEIADKWPGSHRAIRLAMQMIFRGLHTNYNPALSRRAPPGPSTPPSGRGQPASAENRRADADLVSLDRVWGGSPTTPMSRTPQYVGAAHRPFLFGDDGVPAWVSAPQPTPTCLNDRRAAAGRDVHSMRRDLDARGDWGDGQFAPGAANRDLAQGQGGVFDLMSPGAGPVRQKYGAPRGQVHLRATDPTPTNVWPAAIFLLARRLVGSRVV